MENVFSTQVETFKGGYFLGRINGVLIPFYNLAKFFSVAKEQKWNIFDSEMNLLYDFSTTENPNAENCTYPFQVMRVGTDQVLFGQTKSLERLGIQFQIWAESIGISNSESYAILLELSPEEKSKVVKKTKSKNGCWTEKQYQEYLASGKAKLNGIAIPNLTFIR